MVRAANASCAVHVSAPRNHVQGPSGGDNNGEGALQSTSKAAIDNVSGNLNRCGEGRGRGNHRSSLVRLRGNGRGEGGGSVHYNRPIYCERDSAEAAVGDGLGRRKRCVADAQNTILSDINGSAAGPNAEGSRGGIPLPIPIPTPFFITVVFYHRHKVLRAPLANANVNGGGEDCC